MKIETGTKFEVEIEGLTTVMDFVEDRFIFLVKDCFWNDVELQMARTMPLEIDFLYRYDVAVFLLTVGDIDTSDFYFNVQENDWCEALLQEGEPLRCSIVLLDADNLVCLHREVTFSLEDSRQIRASLRRQQEVEFHEGEFDVNASGLMSALEPFEMQPMAQVHAVFGASAK